eukprot:6885321-Pyramimonas_sp.AAC.1
MVEGLYTSSDLEEHISVDAPLGVTLCSHIAGVAPLNEYCARSHAPSSATHLKDVFQLSGRERPRVELAQSSGETCSTHRSSGRQVYRMAYFHAVAGLPREYHSL